MTPRERQSSGAYSTALADLPESNMSGVLSAAGAGEPHWEELYSCLHSREHRELVDSARRQGLLYAIPMPKIQRETGVQPPQPHGQQLLRQFLQGNIAGLIESTLETPSSYFDDTLNTLQKEAVTRALSTPDLCVVPVSSTGSAARVVLEIISQATARGLRVLFLARQEKMLDTILERVAGREPIFAIRCLANNETFERLSPPVRALTFTERSRILRERAFESARQANDETQRRLKCHSPEKDVWDRLAEIAAEYDNVQQLLTAIKIATLEREQLDCRRQLDEVCAELKPLRALADAKQKGQRWRWAWWRATFQKAKFARTVSLLERETQLNDTLNRLTQQKEALANRGSTAGQEHPALTNGKIPSDEELAELEKRLKELTADGERLAAQLELAPLRPNQLTSCSVQQCCERWQQHCEKEKEKAGFLARWLEYLDEFGHVLAGRLPKLANLVAATPNGLSDDEHFVDTAELFDLLVVPESERLSEQEVMALGGRAHRWIFLGAADLLPASASDSPSKSALRKKSKTAPKNGKRTWFQNLCQTLHCDPSQAQYRWRRAGEKLRCRLRDLTSEQQRYVETETVEDQPDIELGIVSQPRCEPILAHVLFPAEMPIAQAKQFIYRELEEVALQAAARNFVWCEDEEHVILHISDHSGAESHLLEDGIREWFFGDDSETCHTARLEFDRAKGWDAAQAREWLQQHLGWRDLGRSVFLIE